MDGYEYENYVAKYLMSLGYKHIKVTQSSGDYGIDVLATKKGVKYAVQCKYYSEPVGVKAVQEVVAGMAYYKCQAAMVVTNNSFTKAAQNLAKVNGVKLMPNIVPKKFNFFKEFIKSIKEVKEEQAQKLQERQLKLIKETPEEIVSNAKFKQEDHALDVSEIIEMPCKFSINGVSYNLDNVKDIESMPMVYRTFQINDKSYSFEDYFYECAKLYRDKQYFDNADALDMAADRYKRGKELKAFNYRQKPFSFSDEKDGISYIEKLNDYKIIKEYHLTENACTIQLRSSKITGLPGRVNINGVVYDLDSIEDIEKLPLVFNGFYLNGKLWYFNNFYRACAKVYLEKGYKDIASALSRNAEAMEKDEEYGSFAMKVAEQVLVTPIVFNEDNYQYIKKNDEYYMEQLNRIFLMKAAKEIDYDDSCSLIINMPNIIQIDGYYYDIDSVKDIERIPCKFGKKTICGEEYYANNYLRMCAVLFLEKGYTKNAVALAAKADEIENHPIYGAELKLKAEAIIKEPGF